MIKRFFKKRNSNSSEVNSLDIVSSVEGQISLAEVETLMELASNLLQGCTIVEIGSYRGKSTIALALGSKRGQQNKVYAIDPHVDFVGVLGAVFGPQDLNVLYRNIINAKVGEIVFVVSLPSINAANAWSEKNIALLFIDGDHSYEGVKSDYEAWEPFVVSGGVIVFHDIRVDGVRQLLDEITEKGSLMIVGTIDEMAWFRKINSVEESG